MLELLKRLFIHFLNPQPPKNPKIITIEKSEIMSNNIKLEELNPHNYPMTDEIKSNINELHEKINKVRDLYGKPMIVTSGLRSIEQQQSLILDGKSNAIKSKHLTGQAVDIKDTDGALRDWIIANMDKMEEIGFWFENFKDTPTWVHFQTCPPRSGNRIFIP